MKKVINYLFYILLFFTPLIVVPITSELFEFNKMVFVYLMTVLIVSAWIVRSIEKGKFIFRRTILDWPIILFLVSQLVSTYFSIDFIVSVFGYPSRLNGGLLSLFSYSLLYWSWVSNMDNKSTRKSILFILVSGVLVSVYGFLQKFGVDEHVWVQDVRARVFSTFGQPNWLAAFLAAISPIAWRKKRVFLSILFILVLVFTKSRSGMFGLLIAGLIYFLPVLKRYIGYVVLGLSVVLFAVVVIPRPTPLAGVTPSSAIRKIVWRGAFNAWKANPIVGTGVESFAYSYYKFKPVEQNLTSEWNFLYNKSHNEFLNYAANTGTFGLVTYLFFIGFGLYVLKKSPALLAGYVSILATNFFGFSVVVTNLYLFLFPAFAITSQVQSTKYKVQRKTKSIQIILVIFVLCSMFYGLFTIGKYWLADVEFASRNYLQAVTLNPYRSDYWMELAHSYADKQNAAASNLAAKKAIALSPNDVNLKKSQANLYLKLATNDLNYLENAVLVLKSAVSLAPADAGLYFTLAKFQYRAGDVDGAIANLGKVLELKPNYTDATELLVKLLVK